MIIARAPPPAPARACATESAEAAILKSIWIRGVVEEEELQDKIEWSGLRM